jgi:hypothetical protein
VPVVFAYLSDPTKRPEWQSSLRRVADVRGTGDVGTTWRDVTMVGARPHMEVTHHELDSSWEEVGRWRGIDATLRLGFTPLGSGTRVHVAFDITTPSRVLGPLVAVLNRLAPGAVRADLQRAVRRIG